MTTTTYWVADADGVRAPVDGVAERDRVLALDDWSLSAEPSAQDFVWMRHEDPALGAVAMSWEAAQLEAWAVRGFAPGLPIDLAAEEPARSSTAKASATSGDKTKEQVNG